MGKYNCAEWRYTEETSDARNTREFFEHRKIVLQRIEAALREEKKIKRRGRK